MRVFSDAQFDDELLWKGPAKMGEAIRAGDVKEAAFDCNGGWFA